MRYYLAVGEGILRALRHRPTTLERWPRGVLPGMVLATRADSRGADAFYQKRIPKGAPDYVETARIAFPSGRSADEICPTDLDLVVEALAANGCFAPTSLDGTPAEGESAIGDRLGDDDSSFDSAEARVALKPLLSHLDRRERIMLEMRFFKGSTQSEIGEVLGITQMQVSRLLSALLARLRDELGGVAL